MKPHEQRVVDEKSELEAKLEKLLAFLDGNVVKTIPIEEQTRLAKQAGIMRDYVDVLAERITNFPTEAHQ